MIGNDWVVRYQNRFPQVKRQARDYAPAKAKVVVCEWEDGRLEIHYRGQKVKWEEISGRPVAPAEKAKPRVARRQPTPPKSDHPWKQPYQQMRLRRPAPVPVEEASLARPSASAMI